jgi:hypothetical protein
MEPRLKYGQLAPEGLAKMSALEHYLKKAPPMTVRHILRVGAAGLRMLPTPAHRADSTAQRQRNFKWLIVYAPANGSEMRSAAGHDVMHRQGNPRVMAIAHHIASWLRDE